MERKDFLVWGYKSALLLLELYPSFLKFHLVRKPGKSQKKETFLPTRHTRNNFKLHLTFLNLEIPCHWSSTLK